MGARITAGRPVQSPAHRPGFDWTPMAHYWAGSGRADHGPARAGSGQARWGLDRVSMHGP